MTQPVHIAPSTEIVPATPRTAAEVAMLDRTTDSWTVVLEQVADLAVKIAGTDFVPDGLRGKPGQVAAAILHGRELGLPPMTALASTHVIKGKPAISAEAMRALVLQAGHQLAIVESTTARCTIRGRRADVDEWTTVTWTMDDARQAGLLNNNQWKTYPRQMLTARASVELARMIFADVIHGMRAIEEMDDVTPWEGLATEVEQTAAPVTTKVRRARKTADPAPAAVESNNEQATPPAAEQTAPERRRPALPTRGSRPEPATVPPSVVADSAPDAGAEDSAPSAPASPSVEEQRDEFRQLAEQHRADPGMPLSEAPAAAADPVDAEVIEEDRRQISPGQRGFLMAQFKRLKVEDRDMRLSYSMALTGRDDLESSNQLTFSQASELIKALEQCRDLDALEALVNGQDTLA